MFVCSPIHATSILWLPKSQLCLYSWNENIQVDNVAHVTTDCPVLINDEPSEQVSNTNEWAT